MFANKFILLLINFLWMIGLFGAFFALLALVQYRRKQRWETGSAAQTPGVLAPLYGSLALFVIGLALYAYAAGQTIGLILAAVWALLALFLLYHWIETMIDGLQEGWDVALTEVDDDGMPTTGPSLSGSAMIVLLAVNVGLLGWWGVGQADAGVLTVAGLTRLMQGETGAAQHQPTVTNVRSTTNETAATPKTTTENWFTQWLAPAATGIAAVGQNSTATPTVLLTPFHMAQAANDNTVTAMAEAETAIAATGTATSAASATATATNLPTTTPTPIATATATASSTPPPTATPTATPLPTETPTPEPTATATATRRPPPTPTVVSGKVEPVNPLDNESSNTKVLFEWRATFPPAEGYAFELVFWQPNQDPLRHGFGVAAPTRGNSAMVDLRRLDNDLGDRLEPKTYRWGVLLVRTTPTYERIRYLGGDWQFTYYR